MSLLGGKGKGTSKENGIGERFTKKIQRETSSICKTRIIAKIPNDRIDSIDSIDRIDRYD